MALASLGSRSTRRLPDSPIELSRSTPRHLASLAFTPCRSGRGLASSHRVAQPRLADLRDVVIDEGWEFLGMVDGETIEPRVTAGLSRSFATESAATWRGEN